MPARARWWRPQIWKRLSKLLPGWNLPHLELYRPAFSDGMAGKIIFLTDYLASREVQQEVDEEFIVENWNVTDDFICYGHQGELATEQQDVVTLSLHPYSKTASG